MNVKKTRKPLEGASLIDAVIEAAQEKLAGKITVIDLRGASVTADFFIICQSESTVHNKAIADAIADRCARSNTFPWHSEGQAEGRWILIDFSDVVVHIMIAELRDYYSLETLWSEGKRRDIPDNAV